MCWYTLKSVHWHKAHNRQTNVATDISLYAHVSAFHCGTRSLRWRVAIKSFSMWQEQNYVRMKLTNEILGLCFHASLIYINNCPTRCNTKQSIYYSASSLYMFRVSTTPIIMSTQNCNYSLRYWSYFFCAATSLQRGQASLVDTRNM